MFGRVPKNHQAFLGTRPNISESHSEISTRVPFCIATALRVPLTATRRRRRQCTGMRLYEADTLRVLAGGLST